MAKYKKRENGLYYTQIATGEYTEAGETLCHHQYETLCERLSNAGYRHYEISNFALPGCEAVHNRAYWQRLPYVGLGPGAHSFDGGRTRSWNSEDLSDWHPSCETLTEEEVTLETLMLGLRTADGLEEDWLRAHCDPAVLQTLKGEGALVPSQEGRLRISEDRFFVSDDLIRTLS